MNPNGVTFMCTYVSIIKTLIMPFVFYIFLIIVLTRISFAIRSIVLRIKYCPADYVLRPLHRKAFHKSNIRKAGHLHLKAK